MERTAPSSEPSPSAAPASDHPAGPRRRRVEPHAGGFLATTAEIARALDHRLVDQLAEELARLREREGRLFVIGVGGSAANSSHAVNDFRKLCGIEAYAPVDNVAELTARANDDGWETVFSGWLAVSRANARDALLVLSVGGGDNERNVSVNIVRAVDEAKLRGLRVLGIVGRDGGHTKQVGDVVVVVPSLDEGRVTPHTEAFQSVLWHCLSCHPGLMVRENAWEGLARART